MTIKQAILSLPKISKRWSSGYNDDDGTVAQLIVNEKQKLYLSTNSSIAYFHAATLTFGYEISYKFDFETAKYIPVVILLNQGVELDISQPFKTPALAIQAAFITAVKDKVAEMK